MEEKNIYDLSVLIVKFLNGEASFDEIKIIDNWKNESVYNEHYYNKIVDENFFNLKQESESYYDKENAYRIFLKRKKRKILLRRWSYAASSVAAVLLIFIGSRYLFENNLSESAQLVLTEDFLAPGKGLAILTTSTGEQYKLGDTHTDSLLCIEGLDVKTASNILYYPHDSLDRIIFNNLSVPRKGEFKVVLSDGTEVWLNSETNLRYPVSFNEDERKVYLEGEAFFDVTENAEKPFIVSVGGNEVVVLGTSFNIKAYLNEEVVYTTLVSGKLKVKNRNDFVILDSGEQAVVSDNNLYKHPVDSELYTGWLTGNFIFENQTLDEIMKSLERWYDINIYFRDDAVKSRKFNGKLKRYDNFMKIVDMLELTGVASFNIKDKDVYISEIKKDN